MNTIRSGSIRAEICRVARSPIQARVRIALLAALLAAGCLSPASSVRERRARVETLVLTGPVPVVFQPRSALAVVTLADALTFSSGFEAGEALRKRLALAPPAAGFAAAVVEALREHARFTGTSFRVEPLPDARATLAALGEAPVLYASVVEWRLVYDLSLCRYRMVLELQLAIVPATLVATGRGAMALPERLWRGACTFRGPEPTLPLAHWIAEDGAILRTQLASAERRCGRRVSERLDAFLERGEEQSALDTGELNERDAPPLN